MESEEEMQKLVVRVDTEGFRECNSQMDVHIAASTVEQKKRYYVELSELEPLKEKSEATPFDVSRNLNYRKLVLYVLTSALVIAHLAVTATYLSLKATLYMREFRQTLQAPWLVIIWFCEFAHYVGSIIAASDHLLPPTSRAQLKLEGKYFPTVDILLPCCNEPTDVPLDSIAAALAMDYPQDRFKLLVLDDGDDENLRAHCHALQLETEGQVLYLKRPKIPGVKHHFKCGNLNYGLQHSSADFVAMMDSDMILHPTFLQKVLPHIINSPSVSFVQVPQSFYNLPVGDPLTDACTMDYDRNLIQRDSFGWASCIGTGALFRRQHLDEIGGFQSQSITEDTTTAYALFNRGYRSVYLNEKLQIGLTPWTFAAYIKQRTRWGQGAFQQFASTWREMLGWNSKLALWQKIRYFWHTGYYFLAIVNILLMATMLGALAFNWNLSVGGEIENRQVLVSLAASIVLWRLTSFALWVDVPQSIQSRNREESHFWWLTPYFFRMILQTLLAYDTTFSFVPTSNVDKVAASTNDIKARIGQLMHVKFHLAYTFVVLSVVGYKVFCLFFLTPDNCHDVVFVVGLSVFLITTCAHMLVPVMHILWPTNFSPDQRKSLLRYNDRGIPEFSPEDCRPKFYWSVLGFEVLVWATLIFWSGVLWIACTQSYEADPWCRVLKAK